MILTPAEDEVPQNEPYVSSSFTPAVYFFIGRTLYPSTTMQPMRERFDSQRVELQCVVRNSNDAGVHTENSERTVVRT